MADVQYPLAAALLALSPIRAGTDVAVMVRHFGFWSLNACRIVYVVEDEATTRQRYGFAYGTLEGGGTTGGRTAAAGKALPGVGCRAPLRALDIVKPQPRIVPAWRVGTSGYGFD
jgi:hypothetical protein